jgi:putative membrane protein
MKKPLKHVILNAVAILILSNVLPGVSYENSLPTLLLAALILSLINLLVKPLLKIVLLPINLLTFGLAGWFIQVITLYLTTLLVEGFTIGGFSTSALHLFGLSIPALHFSGFWAYVGSSFIFSIISNILYWLL